MTTLTETERHALAAIVEASLETTGSETDGWWSQEILMYAKNCPLSPKSFSGACGSLVKKGFAVSQEYDPGEHAIFATEAGIKALAQ